MQQIPKIIHYCWFGGNPKPQLVLDCIESWKKYCPDYEIREWNEGNFDIHSAKYVEEAYEAKKWAFVSDYVRLYALNNYGGVYLDTDMELLKSIDCFLNDEAFIGYETKDSIATGIIGSVKHHRFLSDMLEYYEKSPFSRNGKIVSDSGPTIVSALFRKNGLKLNGKLQYCCNCALYPEKTFYPNGIKELFLSHPKKSYSYHHYMESWGAQGAIYKRSFFQRIRILAIRVGRDVIGTHRMYLLSCWLKGVKP